MAGFPPEDDVSSSKDLKRYWVYLDFSLCDYLIPDVAINRAVQRATATEPLKAEIKDLCQKVAECIARRL